jgi:hypothetical protein
MSAHLFEASRRIWRAVNSHQHAGASEWHPEDFGRLHLAYGPVSTLPVCWEPKKPTTYPSVQCEPVLCGASRRHHFIADRSIGTQIWPLVNDSEVAS